jgi:hypothetical protein
MRPGTVFARGVHRTLISRALSALAMLGNRVGSAASALGRAWLREWTVAIAVALRIFGTAWNIVTSPVHTAADADETVVADLGDRRSRRPSRG